MTAGGRRAKGTRPAAGGRQGAVWESGLPLRPRSYRDHSFSSRFGHSLSCPDSWIREVIGPEARCLEEIAIDLKESGGYDKP